MNAEMEKLTFGCEVEFTGASKKSIAYAIAAVIGGTARFVGHHLDDWHVTSPDGRDWQVVSDCSVSGSCYSHGRDADNGGEMVTPVLKLADMEVLQKVIRAMREQGAYTDSSCGVHIHVGANDMTAKQIQNLVKAFYTQEELIVRAAGTSQSRLNGGYTNRTDRYFVEKISRMANPTMQKIGEAYYGGYIPSNTHSNHYHDARYRTLNLHNLWNGTNHTVEFRFFNFHSNLHAGELRAWVVLALSLVAFSKTAKKASAKNHRQFNEQMGKRDCYLLLMRLGMKGAEYKNVRENLMKYLPGTLTYRRPMVAA